MSYEGYDFSGWASKNDLRCGDGRIIRHGAFAGQDGKRVPLFWNHEHNDISKVLGHAILENRDEGVYAYGYLNNTPGGTHAKECLAHGDIISMSIWANNLNQEGRDVLHGVIREVSLVPAGANPGAFVESVIAHGQPMEDYDEEGIFYTGEEIELAHSDVKETPKEEPKKEKADSDSDEGEMTIQQVVDSMTEIQKRVLYALLAEAGSNKESEQKTEAPAESNTKGESEMKHNLFSDGDEHVESNVQPLSHSDMEKIFAEGKRLGSLRDAVNQSIEDGVLVHTSVVPTNGMTPSVQTLPYGVGAPEFLYPEPKPLNRTPEWISRDMTWVSQVLSGVHRIPFTRVKSTYANITEDEARARGYIKGKQKKEEVFTMLKRTTSPQTVYKLQKMDRDDILDITDFDVVAWIRAEMRVMLDEELARAILIGDGRPTDSEDHISEEHIRPIVKDAPLFNVTIKVRVKKNATPEEIAKALIDTVIRSRKEYKGSGNPTFWTTEDYVTEMLMLEDKIGHKLYKSEGEVATALRVSKITTVEPMEGYELEVSGKKYPLIGVIVNLSDYDFGNDKGGDVSMFDDFDIQYNQYRYLIETRRSGALVKPFSAITLVLDDSLEDSVGPKVASMPEQTKKLASNSSLKVSDLVTRDTKILFNGADAKAYGKTKYVKEIDGDLYGEGQKSGHFFPISLDHAKLSETIIASGAVNKSLTLDEDDLLIVRLENMKAGENMIYLKKEDGTLILALDMTDLKQLPEEKG